MTSKHTPGPWDYWSGYNPFDKLEAEVTAEEGDIVIASYNSLIEQGEANARLIAAAPELLEALQLALKALDEVEGAHATDRLICRQVGEIARATIAKAKGE